MAGTSVLKLKVDGNEYDAGLKKAQQGLQALEKSLQEAGKSFTDVDRQVVEYVRAIGQMETTAKSSRGALRDMTQTLTDLTLQYRSLTDEEKKSPFGEALSQSLEDLTQRASDINDAMGDVSQSITNAASDTRKFDQMAQGVGVLTAGFQGLTGAGKLLGINMGDNVEMIAKLQAAMAVTNSLTTIQTALQKQSALMQGVAAVQAKAAAIAQELLAKNTTAATVAQRMFNTVAKANPYVLLATAIGGVVGVLSLFSSGQREAAEEANTLKSAIDRLNESMQANISLAQQMGAGGEEIARMRVEAAKAEVQMAEAEKNRRASLLGLPGEAGKQAYNQALDAEIAARKRLAEAEKSLAQQQQTRIRLLNTWDQGKSEKEIKARISLLEQLRSEVDLNSKAYADYSNKIAQLEKQLPQQTARTGGKGSKTTPKSPVGSIAALNEELKKLQQQQSLVTSSNEWIEYQRKIFGVRDAMKQLRGELTPNELGAVSIIGIGSAAAEAKQKELLKKKPDTKLVTPREKTEAKMTEQLGQMVGGINSIASGIEGLGIELPKGFKEVLGGLQSMISIASGISSILVAIQAISTADTIIPFHTGGAVRAARGYRVPGNYGYDAVPAILTSGETVLTRAQTGNLASQLAERSSGMVMQPYVEGEKVFLGMNNTTKRMGKGEIVTTSMLRQYGLLN